MRDGLTALAGLLVVALIAALVGPSFVDWRDWRGEIDAQLGAALGVPVASSGAVSLSLLPQARLQIEGLALAPGAPSQATIGRLTLALALPPLLKGEVRVTQATAEGVVATLTHDAQGRVRLPRLAAASLTREAAFEHVSLRGGRIRLVAEGGGAAREIGPISAEMSAARLAGPWRIDAEAARAPLRIATGAFEPATGLPIKVSSNTEERRIALEGAIALAQAGDALTASFSGTASVSIKGEDAAGVAPLALTLRGGVADGRATISSLTLDVEGVGRLEGEGGWEFAAARRGAVALKARRLDGDALPAAAGLLGGLLSEATGRMLPPLDVTLAVDQVALRGEEITDLRGRFALDGPRLAQIVGEAQFAGVRLGFGGDADIASTRASGHVVVRAARLQRLALALQRMGLDAPAADAISALGSLEATLNAAIDGEGLALELGHAESRLGRLDGRLLVRPTGTEIVARAAGFDLARLGELAALWPALLERGDLALDLDLRDVRYGDGPAGSVAFAAHRQAQDWRIGRFTASGFGGLTLRTQPAAEAGAVSARLEAPDAGAVLGVLGLVMPDDIRRWLGQRAGILSPVALDLAFNRRELAASGLREVAWRAEGQLGKAPEALLASFSGQSDAGGRLGPVAGRISGRAATLMALLGLPEGLAGDGWAQENIRVDLGIGAAVAGARLVTIAAAGEGLEARWQGRSPANDALMTGEFSGRVSGDGKEPAEIAGRLSWGAGGLRLDAGRFAAAGSRGQIALRQEADRAFLGQLALDDLDVATLGALAWGPSAGGASGWSGRRFGAAPGLPEARLSLAVGRLSAFGRPLGTDWQAEAGVGGGTIALANVQGMIAGGAVSGEVRLAREGGLKSLSFRVALGEADAATLTDGRLSGRLSLKLDGGASGESPARLVATLNGAGQIGIRDGRIASLSPTALPAALRPGQEREAGAGVGQHFAAELALADWPLDTAGAALTLSAGVLRFGGASSVVGQARLALQGTLDLRSLAVDLRALLTPEPPPTLATESSAQVAVAWRGPFSRPVRSVDVSGLGNVYAARQLKRELERIEDFEADVRERAFFARRLRSERERAATEAAEAAAAAAAAEAEARAKLMKEVEQILGPNAAQAAPSATPAPQPQQKPALPPLPPPMQILPTPTPKGSAR